MTKIKITLVFGNTPNFNKDAFKYFILSLNKVQSIYEFTFPDLDIYPFLDTICEYESANNIFKSFIEDEKIEGDYHIAFISTSFDNNFFSKADRDKTAVLTTDIWERYFSPPSVFEYLMHGIIFCLIYSQKLPKDRMPPVEMKEFKIHSHGDTRGCVADFTGDKIDNKLDILLGYICEQHQGEIKTFFGEHYLNEMRMVLDRKWIGSVEEKGTVAYNLKHAYKFDINKDSGFNKTFWEKCQDKFYEIPGDITGEVLKIILTAMITYLLIKYGIMNKS